MIFTHVLSAYVWIVYTTKKLYIVSIVFIYFLLFIFDNLDKYYVPCLCIERQQKSEMIFTHVLSAYVCSPCDSICCG